MARTHDPTAPPWVTVFSGELLEAQSLEAGLEACGFHTIIREATGDSDAYQVQVPCVEADAVQRYLAERWQEEQPLLPVDDELLRRIHALGLLVRHSAFWMPIMVFAPAISYVFLSSTLSDRPHQHGMSLVASWFAIVATLSIGGLGAYVVAR